MNELLATMHTADGRPVLRFERRLAHPPAALAARMDGAPVPDAAFLPRAERYIEEFGLAAGEARKTPDGYLVRLTDPP